MGWTVSYGPVNKAAAQAEHVADCTTYSRDIKAEILAHEWRAKSFYAIVRLTFLEGHAKPGTSTTFLRTDMIDYSGGKFGYKDMTEEMGPYLEDPPSAAFKKLIFQFIPRAEGYAQDFRKRYGIRFETADPARDLWNNPVQGPSAPDLNQTKMEF